MIQWVPVLSLPWRCSRAEGQARRKPGLIVLSSVAGLVLNYAERVVRGGVPGLYFTSGPVVGISTFPGTLP